MGFKLCVIFYVLSSLNSCFLESLECLCDHCPDERCNDQYWCVKVWFLDKHGRFESADHSCIGEVNQPIDRPLACETSRLNTRIIRSCCNNGSRCNEKLIMPKFDFQYPPVITFMDRLKSVEMIGILLFLATVVFVIFASIIMYLRIRSLNQEGYLHSKSPGTAMHDLKARGATVNEAYTFSSSSGAGRSKFVQRTISNQVELGKLIGKGRYGDVYKATFRGSAVAVKIFPSLEEKSWCREVEIYQTAMLRHENILGFIAADNKDVGCSTQLWLIVEYHAHGSLFDYLNRQPVSDATMLSMMISITAGLVHLHTGIVGIQGKPAIAHRDLKSKNVLVKKDGTCCIADLGLAVCQCADSQRIIYPVGDRVGTKRYMAPEILNQTQNENDFQSYKQSDIYALSMMFWELMRRCVRAGPLDYNLPFHDQVSTDPTFEQMRRVVYVDHIRPTIPQSWHTDEILCPLAWLISECWYDNPCARLSALRVLKNLQRINNPRCSRA